MFYELDGDVVSKPNAPVIICMGSLHLGSVSIPYEPIC
jgi:hypothetical protein